MTDFILNMQHEDLDQLVPNGQLWNKLNHTFEDIEKDKASVLAVQVNQFACGGIAVAVSLSHKIADGSSLCNFFNDWAIMTRLRSWEQKSFVFPGTKLNDLKLKVMAMTADSEQPIMNPTRLEVLNWLLYRCALRAASKSKSGSFKPTGFIMGIKDIKSEFEILQTMPLESVIEEEQRKGDDYYISTSICTYPLYGIDFGWGKPIKVSIAGTMANNNFVAVDTRNGGGIEVFVSLGKEDMPFFQRDLELLSFCEVI
nr:acylsugar acyltransferase 3-like [Tanacetum cinerariifolium]